jgi:uridine phosphorylase
VPKRLRPTAPIAARAILVGDPGRALLLAQDLLEEPKMSNHARGLWGYGGRTAAGEELTIQSTGMGGPSAAVVLADLAKLGVRRAVRIGTCATVGAEAEPGELIVVEAARAEGGSAAAFGVPAGETVLPELELTARLQRELDDAARSGSVASFDTIYAGAEPVSDGVFAVDMQTATVLACARALKIVAATVLIVETAASGERAPDDILEEAAKRAGRAAVRSL